ncbi:MAG: hypothetical protein H0T42_24410 [Deltaproteobacteria bacterium]|nr:hypothetical protein [Deltaproteobacteria bacterium]
MSEARRRTEVLRILSRYLVEVVEAYDLCPWARRARERGELQIDIVWGTPTIGEWVTACEALSVHKQAPVAMVVAPELVIGAGKLHDLRNDVSNRIQSAGIAEFHPEAPLDLLTPARLVPYLRRSPDPLLQLVPLSLLASVRGDSPTVDRMHQVQALGGVAVPPRRDAGDRIADDNHATVSAAHAAITSTLEDIAEDRRRSYELVGISASRTR